MCKMNLMPIDESICPCGSCTEYLTSCMPIIVGGLIVGECDLIACEFCDADCEERSC